MRRAEIPGALGGDQLQEVVTGERLVSLALEHEPSEMLRAATGLLSNCHAVPHCHIYVMDHRCHNMVTTSRFVAKAVSGWAGQRTARPLRRVAIFEHPLHNLLKICRVPRENGAVPALVAAPSPPAQNLVTALNATPRVVGRLAWFARHAGCLSPGALATSSPRLRSGP
jgi:hypothetical protein